MNCVCREISSNGNVVVDPCRLHSQLIREGVLQERTRVLNLIKQHVRMINEHLWFTGELPNLATQLANLVDRIGQG